MRYRPEHGPGEQVAERASYWTANLWAVDSSCRSPRGRDSPTAEDGSRGNTRRAAAIPRAQRRINEAIALATGFDLGLGRISLRAAS